MPIELDITDPKVVKTHMKNLMATAGFQILMQYWNLDREAIIAEGKKGRTEEKTIKQWAVLDGFDRSVSRISQLANLPVEDEEEATSDED